MLRLILESESEHHLKLIRELAEKLDVHCQLIPQKTKSELSNQYELNEAIEFVKQFTQENSSFGDALEWQKAERQERLLD